MSYILPRLPTDFKVSAGQSNTLGSKLILLICDKKSYFTFRQCRTGNFCIYSDKVQIVS